MNLDARPGTAPSPPGMAACPVCTAASPAPLMTVDGKNYFACAVCQARFCHPLHRPARAAEHTHYRLHRNRVDDPAYRRFLGRLAGPLLARLPASARVLDYGCGPGPALAAMLAEAGHTVSLYDPLFAPDPAPLSQTFDAVTCTETAEHFHQPAAQFARLMGLVRPGGWLAVMTCFQTDDARFARWHYRADPTHVVFYREATLRHLAARAGWSCTVPVKDVALLRRPSADGGAAGPGRHAP